MGSQMRSTSWKERSAHSNRSWQSHSKSPAAAEQWPSIAHMKNRAMCSPGPGTLPEAAFWSSDLLGSGVEIVFGLGGKLDWAAESGQGTRGLCGGTVNGVPTVPA